MISGAAALAAAGHGDRVAAHRDAVGQQRVAAAMDDRDRADGRALDREVVVAGAEHDLDDLEVGVVDARGQLEHPGHADAGSGVVPERGTGQHGDEQAVAATGDRRDTRDPVVLVAVGAAGAFHEHDVAGCKAIPTAGGEPVMEPEDPPVPVLAKSRLPLTTVSVGAKALAAPMPRPEMFVALRRPVASRCCCR